MLSLIARLRIQDLVLEGLPVRVSRGLFNDDFRIVIGELVDDVFDGFLELEIVELADALGGYGDSVCVEEDRSACAVFNVALYVANGWRWAFRSGYECEDIPRFTLYRYSISNVPRAVQKRKLTIVAVRKVI